MSVRSASVALAAVVVASSCGFEGRAGDRPDGFRLVQGTITIEDDRVLGSQTAGLQLAAVVVQPGFQLFTSDVFDPRDARGDGPQTAASFVVAVDVERAFNLVLQVAGATPTSPGAFLGALAFDDGHGGTTTLIPRGADFTRPEQSDLDLGALRVVVGASPPRDNALLQEATDDPLGQVDTDKDGTDDLVDEDDDDDEVPDVSDDDVAGDGLDDGTQLLSSLPDANKDGVRDPFTSR